MRGRHRRSAREGMSLLEVLIALAIFLMSLIVLGRLVIMAGERARDVQDLARATQLCQSQLAQVIAGAVPLNGQSGAPLDDDPDWTWSLDCSPDDIPNLWSVTVRVSRERPDGEKIECVLSQKVLDPSMRGSTFDTPAQAAQSSSTPTSGGGQ